MNIVSSSGKIALAKYLQAAISFASIVIFAQMLGVKQMGTFFLFQAIAGMLTIPANFGIRRATTKRLSEGQNSRDIFATSVTLKIIPIIIIIIGIVTFRSSINSYLGENLALFLAIFIFIREYSEHMLDILEGEMRVGETAPLIISRYLIFISFGTLFLYLGYQVQGIVIALLAGYFLMLVLGLYKQEISFGTPSKVIAKSLIGYGKFDMLSHISSFTLLWIDVIMIGIFLHQSDVGAYEAAWRVSLIVVLLSRAIGVSIFPHISRWNANGTQDKIQQVLPKVLLPALLISPPAFFGTILLSEEILSLLFGSGFALGKGALIILMFSTIFQSLEVIFRYAIQGIDRPELTAIAAIIAVLVNTALNLILVWKFGIIGAAAATCLSFMLYSLILGQILSTFINIRFHWKRLAIAIILSLLMYIILKYIKSILIIDSIVELIFIILIGIVIYCILVLSVPTLRRDVRSLSTALAP